MSYYLKSVDFSDPESIKSCDVTEFVRLCKFVFEYYNIHQRDSYSANEKISDNFKTNKRKLEWIFNKFKDVKELDEYKNLYETKYKNLNLEEELFTKKIRFYECDDHKEDYETLFRKGSTTSFYYHPSYDDVPFWVEDLPFPDHGGDEEGYYLKEGLDSWIDMISSERAYSIKKRNIVMKFHYESDQGLTNKFEYRIYFMTIGRSAHA